MSTIFGKHDKFSEDWFDQRSDIYIKKMHKNRRINRFSKTMPQANWVMRNYAASKSTDVELHHGRLKSSNTLSLVTRVICKHATGLRSPRVADVPATYLKKLILGDRPHQMTPKTTFDPRAMGWACMVYSSFHVSRWIKRCILVVCNVIALNDV